MMAGFDQQVFRHRFTASVPDCRQVNHQEIYNYFMNRNILDFYKLRYGLRSIYSYQSNLTYLRSDFFHF